MDVVWHLRVDAELPLLPAPLPEAGDPVDGPLPGAGLAQEGPSRVPRAGVDAAAAEAGAEHVAGDVVLGVGVEALALGYDRDLEGREKQLIPCFLKLPCIAIVAVAVGENILLLLLLLLQNLVYRCFSFC